MSAIDRASPIPLHAQFKQILLEQITCGAWEAGTRVPSEKQLETAYGLSRITVRHTLSTLVRQGVLVRVRGHGTFVAQPKLIYHLAGDIDLRNPMRQAHAEVEIRLVDSQWMAATLLVAHALNVPLHSRVFCIQRLQTVGGERIAYSYAYVSQACAQRMKVACLVDEDSLAYLRHLLHCGTGSFRGAVSKATLI